LQNLSVCDRYKVFGYEMTDLSFGGFGFTVFIIYLAQA